MSVHEIQHGLRICRGGGTTYVGTLVGTVWIPVQSITGEVATSGDLKRMAGYLWYPGEPLIQYGQHWSVHLTPEQRRKYVR